MALKTALVLAGEDAGATAVLANAEKALERVEKTTNSLARAQAAAKTAAAQAKAEYQAGAISLEQYNRALIEAKTELGLFEARHRAAAGELRNFGTAAGVSTGQAQAGYVNLGRQMQDVAVQLQGGANIGTIIAQQGGQVADAVAMMGGRFSGFASFMRGPWGAGITVGIGFLFNLISAMQQSGDAADQSKDAHLTLADALQKNVWGTDAATKALQDYNAEQDRSRKSSESMIKINLAMAESRLKDALATRTQIEAELAKQQNIATQFQLANPDTVGADLGVQFAEKALGQNASKIADLRKSIGELRIKDAVRDAKAAVDPIQAINNKYDDMAAAAERAAAGNAKLQQSLKGVLTGYEKQRQSELDAANKRSRSSRSGGASASAAGATDDSVGSMRALLRQLFGVGTYIGDNAKHKKFTSSGTVSDHWGANARALDFVPEGGLGKYTFEQIQQMLEAAGVNIRYGRSGTKQLFGPGHGAKTKNDHADHFHVAWSGTVDPDKVASAAKRSQEIIDGFATKAADSVGRINAQFDAQPRLVDQVKAATAELDATIKSLNGKLSDGTVLTAEQRASMERTVEAAKAAKGPVQEALVRPFQELRQESERRLQIGALITAGREDEAAALQIIWQKEADVGKMTAAQKQDVLEMVKHERAITDELDRRREVIGYYLDASRSIRDTFTQLFSGGGFNFKNIEQSFKKLNGQVITEQLFGGMFRDLDTWLKGQSGLSPSVDFLAGESQRAGDAVGGLADAVNQAAASLASAAAVAPGSLEANFDATFGKGSTVGAVTSAAALVGHWTAAMSGGQSPKLSTAIAGGALKGTILSITPTEYFHQLGQSVGGRLTDALNKSFDTRFFSQFSGAIGGVFEGYASTGTGFGAVLGGLKELKGLPTSLSKGLGKAFGGAQTGSLVSGISNAIGIKMSNTGAQIGGAIGSFLPIPGGQIIGSIAGGLIGGLFSKAKTGGVSIGAVNGATAITGTGGNNASLKSALNQTGGSINSALAQIAQQLGGSIGSYSVAIGQRKDEFRVSASGNVGNTTAKKTGSDIIYKGKDEAAAMQAAFANAIQDGAIKGISAAVQKALQSTPNVDQAIQEALKVQDVETAIGGLGAALKKQFTDFEKQAAERLRIAQQYGFDVVAMEKRNADDRLKLSQKLLADQIGSLQQLIDDMTSGALFEGSAVDQRNALLDKIAAAKAEANAGTEGAADKLSSLLQQLNSVSKDAFATTGTFAADRSTILDTARDTIARANQRIADAQAGSDPALATTNATLDEIATQNAQALTQLGLQSDYLKNISLGLGGTDLASLSALARTS